MLQTQLAFFPGSRNKEVILDSYYSEDRAQIDNIVFQHRQQYRDQSGTLFDQKVAYFHYPTAAEEQFLPKVKPPKETIGTYPNTTKAALEYTYDLERGPKEYELWHKV